MLEIVYRDEVIGWIDSASAFEPANLDLVYLNAMTHKRWLSA